MKYSIFLFFLVLFLNPLFAQEKKLSDQIIDNYSISKKIPEDAKDISLSIHLTNNDKKVHNGTLKVEIKNPAGKLFFQNEKKITLDTSKVNVSKFDMLFVEDGIYTVNYKYYEEIAKIADKTFSWETKPVNFFYSFVTPHRLTVALPDNSNKTLLDVYSDKLEISWTYDNLIYYPFDAFRTPRTDWKISIHNVTYDATGAAEPTAQLLESTLTRLDASLYQESERAVRAELDGLIQQFAEYGIYAPRLKIHDDTITVNLKGGELLHNAARFFQAYEMLNEPRYLRAGLKTADLFLQIQQPRGHFPVRIIVRRGGRVTAEGELWEAPEMIRLQDNIQYPSFCLLLYAHKLTGEAKYFDAAKRCADLVHSLQNPENGSVPDYVGPTKPNFPFPLCWPNAQSDPDLVTTWAGIMNGGSFNDDATTDAFRMSVMMYHLSKDPSYLDRSSKIGQWMFDTQLGEGLVRGWCEQYGPDNQPAWVRWWEGPVIHSRTFQQCVGKMLAWFYAVTGEVRYRTLFEETYNWMRTVETPGDAGGLPRSFLPDGSPVFSHNWKTYRYDRPETWPDPRRMTADELSVWNNDTQPDGGHRVSVQSAPHRAFEKKFDENQKIKQLLDVGGRDALRAWHRGPTQYSHVQYLEARLAAARRLLAREIRGKGLTPWEHVWDYRLAQGWIDAKVAAHGGRGLESYASPRPHWMEQCMEVEDWLDITRWGLNPSRDRKEETVASKIRFSLQNADLYSFWFEHGNDQKRGEL